MNTMLTAIFHSSNSMVPLRKMSHGDENRSEAMDTSEGGEGPKARELMQHSFGG
jgi:hypothetical protein